MAHERRIDLNLLCVLDAIHAEGGVTRAAERLNLTQSAVSHSLSRLRHIFGDPLFVREGQQLTPTPLTRSIVQPLRQTLQSLGLMVANAGRFDPATTRASFTISVRDPLDVLVLPAIMRRIETGAPHVDLQTVQARRRSLETALAGGRLDLALDVPLPLPDSVHRQPLTAGRLVVVARRGHPQARRGMTLATYLAQEHVMVTSRRKGPALEDLALHERGLKRRVRLRCRNYFAAFRVVSQTNLVVTMAERYTELLNAPFKNQIMPFPIKAPALELILYWHASVHHDAANRWLRDEIVRVFKT